MTLSLEYPFKQTSHCHGVSLGEAGELEQQETLATQIALQLLVSVSQYNL